MIFFRLMLLACSNEVGWVRGTEVSRCRFGETRFRRAPGVRVFQDDACANSKDDIQHVDLACGPGWACIGPLKQRHELALVEDRNLGVCVFEVQGNQSRSNFSVGERRWLDQPLRLQAKQRVAYCRPTGTCRWFGRSLNGSLVRPGGHGSLDRGEYHPFRLSVLVLVDTS